MKKFTYIAILVLGVALQIGCDSGKKGSSAATPGNGVTDPGVNGYCSDSYQVYTTSYGCLYQRPGFCRPGEGFYPANGTCHPGVSGSSIPTGFFQNTVQITNISKYREMLKKNFACHQSTCPSDSQILLGLEVSSAYQNHQNNGTQLPWYYASSAAAYDQAAYGYQPQGQFVKINMMSYGRYHTGSVNFQISGSALPVTGGFKLISRGNGYAYNKRTTVTVTYLDSARTQMDVKVVYDNVLVAQGTIVKRY